MVADFYLTALILLSGMTVDATLQKGLHFTEISLFFWLNQKLNSPIDMYNEILNLSKLNIFYTWKLHTIWESAIDSLCKITFLCYILLCLYNLRNAAHMKLLRTDDHIVLHKLICWHESGVDFGFNSKILFRRTFPLDLHQENLPSHWLAETCMQN